MPVRINNLKHKVMKINEKQTKRIDKPDGTYQIDFSDGVFGYRILQRLPDYIWRLVKPFATYHKGDDWDEEDADYMGYDYDIDNSTLKGWFYTEKAIQALIDSGYKIFYLRNEIGNISELPGIVKKRREEEKRYYNAERAYEEAAQTKNLKTY